MFDRRARSVDEPVVEADARGVPFDALACTVDVTTFEFDLQARTATVLALTADLQEIAAALTEIVVDLQSRTAEATASTPPGASQSRTKGAVALRNEKRASLVTVLEEVRTFVQSQADASPENGASMIESSGIALRRTPVRPSLGFHAKPGAVSGAVKLFAPAAARRASYEWQMSTDAGATWSTLPPTLQARTTVPGLKAQSTVQFRFRAVTKAGGGDWSQALAVAVQ